MASHPQKSEPGFGDGSILIWIPERDADEPQNPRVYRYLQNVTASTEDFTCLRALPSPEWQPLTITLKDYGGAQLDLRSDIKRILAAFSSWNEGASSKAFSESLLEASESTLLDTLESGSGEDRANALLELKQRDHDLGAFLARELGEDSIDLTWLSALIFCAETAELTDETLRRTIADRLFFHALALRDDRRPESQKPLWAAVRRFASLTPVNELVKLLEFMRPIDKRDTRQVALQAAYFTFEVREPEGDLMALASRIETIAHKYLDQDWLVSPDNTALALNAFCAAVMMPVSGAKALADLLLREGNRRLVRRCHKRLKNARRRYDGFEVLVSSLAGEA